MATVSLFSVNNNVDAREVSIVDDGTNVYFGIGTRNPTHPFEVAVAGSVLFSIGTDGAVASALPATKGYAYTGTTPATVAGAGTSAGTFWSITAPNGGDSSGAAGGNGGSLSWTTGDAGASVTGGGNGGTSIWTLGKGTGSGSPGYQTISATFTGANTVPALSPYPVWPALGVRMTFTALSHDVDSTTANGIKALATYTTTDTSAFNYVGKYGGMYNKFSIKTTGTSTIDHAETLSSALEIVAGAAGTLTTGYGVSGELLAVSTNGYTVSDYSCLFGTMQLGGNMVGGTLQVVNATALISTSQTVTQLQNVLANSTLNLGTVTTLIGVHASHPTITSTAIATTVYGIQVDAQFNTASNTSTSPFDNYGIQVTGGSQGGNTSGTTHNYAGYYVVGTGASGSGGATNNYGLRITGAGGAAGSGTTSNFALYSDSTAQSIIAGPLGIGPGASGARTDSFVTVDIAFPGTLATTYYHYNAITRCNGADTQLVGFRAVGIFQASGVLASYAAFRVDAPTWSGGNATTTAIGFDVGASLGNVSATNAVGARIFTQASAGTANISLLIGNTIPSGTWALYSSNAGNSSVLGSLAIGSNTAAVGTGALAVEGVLARYNAVATAGWGLPAIYTDTRPGTKSNVTTTIATYTVGAADGTFEVACNVNVTVSTTMTMTVTLSYTDETNTARVLTVPFFLLAGTLVQSITTAQGNIAYESMPIYIRCKAATTITLATAGTVTACTYTSEGTIKQVA